ncbi:substrate-binding periplasmic protein [Shewanella sp.]|uniref:substrate-binding periplasmic protein n=1 Tax=Shewanella sp. TaxID=50422 RepID=UPI00356397B4
MTQKGSIFSALMMSVLISFAPLMIETARADDNDNHADIDPGTHSLRLLTEPLPPFSFIENSRLTGFSVELVEQLKSRLGISADIEVLPWARAFNIASQSSNVLLFSTALRDSRRSQFDFVGPIATAKIMLYKRADDESSPANIVEAARMGSIGVYRGSPAERILQQADIKNVEVSTYPLQSLRQLLASRVRYWCQVDLTVGRLLAQAGGGDMAVVPLAELERIDLYLAFSRGTSREMVERWQYALQAFQQEGHFAHLYERWFKLVPESAQSQILWRLTP